MRRDVQEIFRNTPHGKQVMMFSATLSKEIRPVCKKFMQDVIQVHWLPYFKTSQYKHESYTFESTQWFDAMDKRWLIRCYVIEIRGPTHPPNSERLNMLRLILPIRLITYLSRLSWECGRDIYVFLLGSRRIQVVVTTVNQLPMLFVGWFVEIHWASWYLRWHDGFSLFYAVPDNMHFWQTATNTHRERTHTKFFWSHRNASESGFTTHFHIDKRNFVAAWCRHRDDSHNQTHPHPNAMFWHYHWTSNPGISIFNWFAR